MTIQFPPNVGVFPKIGLRFGAARKAKAAEPLPNTARPQRDTAEFRQALREHHELEAFEETEAGRQFMLAERVKGHAVVMAAPEDAKEHVPGLLDHIYGLMEEGRVKVKQVEPKKDGSISYILTISDDNIPIAVTIRQSDGSDGSLPGLFYVLQYDDEENPVKIIASVRGTEPNITASLYAMDQGRFFCFNRDKPELPSRFDPVVRDVAAFGVALMEAIHNGADA